MREFNTIVPKVIDPCALHSFGGGSEMMQNGDPDGIWHTSKGAQRYDCQKKKKEKKKKLIDFFTHSFYSREALFMSHVPWLGSMVFSVPGLATNLKTFRARGQNWARQRINNGSTHKDIFYHLVSLLFFLASQKVLFFKVNYTSLMKITLLLSNQPFPRLSVTVCLWNHF